MASQPSGPTKHSGPTNGNRGGSDIVQNPLGGGRETVESIVVAFVLALLFRTFEAEAFVIPTGSMANTLMGRHRDLVCETCGTSFRVGASKELNDATCQLNPRAFVDTARCPGCGAVMRLTDPAGAYKHAYPPFAGDRIIVEKFAYDFVDPSRWDVIVFKYPEDARTHYIKRLVGLPGETVFISGGDVWTSQGMEEEPTIARKPPDRMRAMLQPVSDSRHVAETLRETGWPDAWTDWASDATRPRWTTDDGSRTFSVTAGEPAMLRWRHFVPEDWLPGTPPAKPEPVLVGDFQPYNQDPEFVGVHRSRTFRALVDGGHWVGDLAVECMLESADGAGVVTVDLVEAGMRHACSIDVATGIATFSRDGVVLATGTTPIRGKGRWQVLVANVDDELSLAVNGWRVATDASTTWTRSLPEAARARPVVRGGQPGETEPDDLAPVGITMAGGSASVTDLTVLRDIYYIASDTQKGLVGREAEEPFLEFPLVEDQFFVLGDNSSASKDGRAWGSREKPLHHVDRRLLVGRALVVFWPHGVPTPWNVKITERCGWELRLPFLPNFARMRFVK